MMRKRRQVLRVFPSLCASDSHQFYAKDKWLREKAVIFEAIFSGRARGWSLVFSSGLREKIGGVAAIKA